MRLQMKNNGLVSSREEEGKKMLQTNKHFVTAGHTKASTLFRNRKSTVLLSMRKVDPTRMRKGRSTHMKNIE